MSWPRTLLVYALAVCSTALFHVSHSTSSAGSAPPWTTDSISSSNPSAHTLCRLSMCAIKNLSYTQTYGPGLPDSHLRSYPLPLTLPSLPLIALGRTNITVLVCLEAGDTAVACVPHASRYRMKPRYSRWSTSSVRYDLTISRIIPSMSKKTLSDDIFPLQFLNVSAYSSWAQHL